MSTVPERHAGATDPPPQVDLADPAARATWLAAMGEQTADIAAAALDATAAPASRDLGRRGARRIITDAADAIGVLLATAGHVASKVRRARPVVVAEPHAPDDARTVAAMGAAARDFACEPTPEEQDDALQTMPFAGVLFLALTGTRGERAGIDPPLLQALCALRDTVNGWIDAPGGEGRRTSIAFADLDLFSHRLGATIEIARRAGMGGAP